MRVAAQRIATERAFGAPTPGASPNNGPHGRFGYPGSERVADTRCVAEISLGTGRAAGNGVRLIPVRALGDSRLVARAAAGDRRAFTTIYERYHQQLYRFCRSIVRSDEDARDALQSTMTAAFRALADGRTADEATRERLRELVVSRAGRYAVGASAAAAARRTRGASL